MEAKLTALDTATVKADWLCELLMNLSIVEKPLSAILMNYGNQTVIALDTATVKVDWLCELLMNLSIVEKPLSAILMNYGNQTVIVKLDRSKDNVKSSKQSKDI
jgi:DNA-binding protein Fis